MSQYYNLLQTYWSEWHELKSQRKFHEADKVKGIINRLRKRIRANKQ